MMANLRNTLQQRWLTLSVREQRGLMVVGFLLLVWLAWQVLIAPAQNKLRQAESNRQIVAQQLAHMKALQAQAQALQQRTPMSRDSALRALQSVASPSGIQLNPQGERVLVTFKAVPAHVLSEWLAQARKQAQALPSEVHLLRSPNNSSASSTAGNTSTPTSQTWDGSLVLMLPRGAQAGSP
jgi:general secretion pathway protein M